MLLAVLVPAVMFATAAGSLYRRAVADAQARVDRAARVAEEHALKVFETNVALLNRVSDLLGDESDQALLSREARLHQQVKHMAADLPQLQGLFVIDSTGHMITTNRVFPAPHSIDYSDRSFFRHHRSGGAQPFISELLTSRTTGEPFFDLSLRRTRTDGSFGGTLSASMAPRYFSSFYSEVTGKATELTVTLVRSDGAVLAGWPQTPVPNDRAASAAASGVSSASASASASAGARAASDDARTPSPPDRTQRVQVARQLGSYPVYVTAGMAWPAVLAPWYRQLALMFVLTFPTAAGLVYIAWIALQRTRRTLEVIDELKEETITRQRAEESLRQAQKLEAMGRLTGGVAHDFNNLLMIISSNLYLHRRRLPEVANSGQLTAIERAVAAGSKLTRQLLSFSRRQALHHETISLQERLPGVFELVKPALGAAVQVELALDPATPSIEADAAELELAILNLAINAKDAMPGGGRLQVNVSDAPPDEPVGLQGRFVMISMRDSGAGIEPHLLQRVFEPFFTTKPVGEGTGLGLSQVYGFCKRAGGTATIDSLRGEGTTVRMYFPVAKAAPPARPDPAGHAGDAGQAQALFVGLRVLLVEDNDDVAEATRQVLLSMGCTAYRVANADAAMAHLAKQASAFDILLSDIVMPGSIDGIELASRARALHPALAVLLLSGFSESMEMATSMQFDVLPKPCAPAALAAALRMAVAHTRRLGAEAVDVNGALPADRA